MTQSRPRSVLGIFSLAAAVCTAVSGCTVPRNPLHKPVDKYNRIAPPKAEVVETHDRFIETSTFPPNNDIPKELFKATLPTYTVEPPDILLVDVIKMVPKQPYRVSTLDVLQIQALGTLPDQPVAGMYPVGPGGLVNLGAPYGSVMVAGLTLAEAEMAVEDHLRTHVQLPEVSVTLAVPAAQQMITGQHLVAPDGTISLGSYGRVLVVGMTLDQAKHAIESHLSQFLEAPEVSVDVFAYNSKFYYVITQGAGLGDGVARFPITGNETVLDAIANVNGLEAISSKKIWIARPSPAGRGCDQILPVDWPSVTMLASTATNYQILPGDRVYVAQDKLVAFDTKVAKITSPFERIFGFTLLGTSTVQRFKFFHRFNGGGGGL